MLLRSIQGGPEFNVLCLIARPEPDHSHIAAALKGDIDWSNLVILANAHGVRPQLIRALRQLNWAGVPSKAQQSLLDFLSFHKTRSLFLASELIKVSDHFSQKAIRFATFKGPSLAVALYGDLSLRECNDIDVIVEEHRI